MEGQSMMLMLLEFPGCTGMALAVGYQVRCKVPQLCTDDGVKVVVTDYGEGDKTDFILSTRSYARMAHANAALDLIAYGVVDVEYRRIPCQCAGYNIKFKVHEHSRFHEYLAIVILYQGGQNDILAVEIWQEDCQAWIGMRRAFGAVWDMANPLTGYLTLRFKVSGSGGLTWFQATNAIPTEWKAEVVYDTDIQL